MTGATFWAFVQSIERIRDWRVNRALLEEQLTRAQLENQRASLDLDAALAERGSLSAYQTVVRRLEAEAPRAEVELQLGDPDPDAN